MVSADTHLVTVGGMKASTLRTRSTVMGSTHGRMAEFTRDTGKMESSTGSVSTRCHQEMASREGTASGRRVPESNGSTSGGTKTSSHN